MLWRPFALAFLAFSGLSLVSGADPKKPDSKPAGKLDAKVQAYLDAHCVSCHGAEVAKSGFRVDTLSPKVGFENTPQWLEIMERINSGEMPPKNVKNRPTAEESARVVEWIAGRMKEGESARLAARGRVTYNRLTRDEYVHTVRDLLGVHFDATDPGGFLDDPEWRGFERLGSVLTLSPSNIEKYLAAGETILAEAYPAKKPEFLEYTKRAITENQVDEFHRERLRELGLLDKVRYELWPGDLFRYSADRPLPEAGIYEVTYTLSGLKPKNGRAPRIFVYEEKLDRVLHQQDVIAPENQPTTVTFRTHLPKGRPSIHVINEVPGPSNLPRSGRHGRRPFVSIADGRMPWQIKLTDEQGNARYPFLILDSISWKGPIITDDEQRHRDAYMPKEETLAAARIGLGNLAKRAFRRPVPDAELDKYVDLVKSELAAKEKFRDAMKSAMLAILCSKSFLFLAEGDESRDRQTLTDWELASRLSYFLWSTMPDEELFRLAEQGKLHEKEILRKQVARMLADPRAARFADSFASQWLQLKKVGRFPPDKKLYPTYDAHLEKSMVGETKAFFGEVLAKNLSLREFLDSDWTMLNQRLAEYYGLPADGLPRDGFARAPLPADSHRGGILTHAAILSLTSDGTRHRPVHRGVWVSESIFAKSPPPPPANVDPIEPNPVTAPKATLRMKLEAHIHDARCASCHSRIDPLGLAFENFDAIGRWRTEEITEGTGKNPTVNPAGKLPDGREYKTPEEFKKLLVADIDGFNAAFVEKLATYGLRRSVSFDDRQELANIAAASKDKDYRLRDLVEIFVLSDLFAKR